MAIVGTIEAPITLITFNIRLGIQEGLESIAANLKKCPAPDILALQEVGDYWKMGPPGDSTGEIANLLKLPHYFHVPALLEKAPPGKGKTGHYYYGHSLLSRWPFEERTILTLPQKTDEPRALLRSVLRLPSGSVEILSTHLSYKEEDRRLQGKFLCTWLRNNPPAPDTPRFIMGDLNADLDADREDRWLAELLSEFIDSDNEEKRKTYPSEAPRLRLDYILGQGATHIETKVGSDSGPSDHYLLISRWEVI